MSSPHSSPVGRLRSSVDPSSASLLGRPVDRGRVTGARFDRPAGQVTGSGVLVADHAQSRTACLMAVWGGARTIGAVAERVGLARSTAHKHLIELEADGLVRWDEGRAATLRPAFGVVRGPWVK